MTVHTQVEHIFRHEYGRLVAMLLHRVGSQNLSEVEDAVQFSMMQAIEFWPRKSTPQSPAAWLYKVAYRKLLSDFRNSQRRDEILKTHTLESEDERNTSDAMSLQGELNDALLRMLFITCDPGIPVESQLVFTLKSLCGFSVKEIAHRLITTEANVYKRISRARDFFSQHNTLFEDTNDTFSKERLERVHQILYLVFTEGYLSSHSHEAIRTELCEEAIRLTEILASNALGKGSQTDALLALMYLHLARSPARQDSVGTLLLLEQQNRSLWNQDHIKQGLTYLQQSAQGNHISRYHIEAGIAAEHCLARSFNETPWPRIIASYELLATLCSSPMHHLSKAIAIAQYQGPQAGLTALNAIELPAWLARSYQWYAVKADLLLRCGQQTLATEATQKAMQLAPSKKIKQLLTQRLIR